MKPDTKTTCSVICRPSGKSPALGVALDNIDYTHIERGIMRHDMIQYINEAERTAEMSDHDWNTYQKDIRQPRYVERTIRALPKPLKALMANHVLRGCKYTCSDITTAGNRWWIIRDENGAHLRGCGGALLTVCVPRVQAELERRDGILPEELAPAQTQLGKQLGPKAGLVRRAR